MDVNRIFSAEQIAVPPDLPLVIKDWTKAVISDHPEDLLRFSLAWFEAKAALVTQRKAAESQIRRMRQLVETYDVDGNGRMEARDLARFLVDDLGLALSENELEELALDLDADSTGFIELSDIIQWFSTRR